MSNSQIARILDTHRVSHFIEKGRIYAITGYLKRNGQTFYTHEDLTGSTKADLLAYLGY